MPTLHEPDSPGAAGAPGALRARRPARAAHAAHAAPRAAAACVLIAALALRSLAGCGGGVDSGGTGAVPESATQVTIGAVSGFGSIVVAGIHHDDSGSQIVDDEGRPLAADALKLGTMTHIEGSAVAAGGTRRTSTARRVRVVEQLVGPVEHVDVAAAALVVLGQRVVLATTTVFDAQLAGGLAALRPGDLLAVHGQFDVAGGRIVATRVEPRPPAPAAAAHVLRAPVGAYARGARRAVLGGVEIDLSGLADAELPASLPAGTMALARLVAQAAGNGVAWRATALRADAPVLRDGEQVGVEGRVTTFVSPQSFSVDGMPVDARAAAFAGGTAGLVTGARVEVEGRVVDGVLVARAVEVESDDDDGSEGGRFELEGPISAADGAAKTFVVRGITVSHAGPPRYEGGGAADLVPGRKVSVRGTLSADRTRLDATSIAIEH